jgi:hypothetical protein
MAPSKKSATKSKSVKKPAKKSFTKNTLDMIKKK